MGRGFTRPFREAAIAVLEHNPSGGRVVLEEIGRLLAADVDADAVVICLDEAGGRSDRAEVVAVWAADGRLRCKLEWEVMDGRLAQALGPRHAPVLRIGSMPVWDFDSKPFGLNEGWALPIVNGQGMLGVVCLFFDRVPPPLAALAGSVRDFGDLAGRAVNGFRHL